MTARKDPWTTLRLAVAWIVLVLWAASVVLDSIPSLPNGVAPNLTPLMTLLVGVLFAPEWIAATRRRNGRKKEEDDE